MKNLLIDGLAFWVTVAASLIIIFGQGLVWVGLQFDTFGSRVFDITDKWGT